MKKYIVEDVDIMYVGTAEEVKATYKAIKRASGKVRNWTRLVPCYDRDPIYNYNKLYGLYIDVETGWVTVSNEHTVLSLIVEGLAVAA